MSKYSSYKEHQLITENWRKFLNESDTPEEGEALEEIFGFGKSKEEKAQAYFDNNWPKIEDMIGDDPGSQIRDRVEKWLQEYPGDANDKGIQGAVESAIRYHKRAQEREDSGPRWDPKADAARDRAATKANNAKNDARRKKEREDRAASIDSFRRSTQSTTDPDAWLRTQSGPSAGSSTDRRRRRNRGELEENKKK